MSENGRILFSIPVKQEKRWSDFRAVLVAKALEEANDDEKKKIEKGSISLSDIIAKKLNYFIVRELSENNFSDGLSKYLVSMNEGKKENNEVPKYFNPTHIKYTFQYVNIKSGGVSLYALDVLVKYIYGVGESFMEHYKIEPTKLNLYLSKYFQGEYQKQLAGEDSKFEYLIDLSAPYDKMMPKGYQAILERKYELEKQKQVKDNKEKEDIKQKALSKGIDDSEDISKRRIIPEWKIAKMKELEKLPKFFLPDKGLDNSKVGVYSKKLWDDLKNKLRIDGDNVEKNKTLIWGPLENYLVECETEGSSVRKNLPEELCEHILNYPIFPSEESILKLFNKGLLPKNPNSGQVLRSLDVLVSFITDGEQHTLKDFFGMEQAHEMKIFLTPFFKEKASDEEAIDWEGLYHPFKKKPKKLEHNNKEIRIVLIKGGQTRKLGIEIRKMLLQKAGFSTFEGWTNEQSVKILQNLKEFAVEFESDFSEEVQSYIKRVLSSFEEIKNDGFIIERIFGEGDGFGGHIELADIICAYSKEDPNETFFTCYGIESVDELLKQIAPKVDRLAAIMALSDKEDIYRMYPDASQKRKEKEPLIDKDCDKSYVEGFDDPKNLNVIRFWFPNRKGKKPNLKSKEIWELLTKKLKERGDIKIGGKNGIYDDIWYTLNNYRIECIENPDILPPILQAHINKYHVFKNVEDVRELFDLQNGDNLGTDLRSLDFLIFFITNGSYKSLKTFFGFGNNDMIKMKEFLSPKFTIKFSKRNKYNGWKSWDVLYLELKIVESNRKYFFSKRVSVSLLAIFILLVSFYWNFKTITLACGVPVKEDGKFRIVVTTPTKQSGDMDVLLDDIIRDEIEARIDPFSKKEIDIEVILDPCYYENYQGKIGEENAKKIGREFQADIVIWEDYVKFTGIDTLSAVVEAFWFGNFDTLLPLNSIQAIARKSTIFSRLGNPLEEQVREEHKRIALDAHMSGYEYAQKVEPLIDWIFFLKYLKEEKPIQAFNVIKDYQDGYNIRFIVRLLEDYPNLLPIMEKYYNNIKVENGVIWSLLSMAYSRNFYEHCPSGFCGKTHIDILTKSNLYATKAIPMLEESALSKKTSWFAPIGEISTMYAIKANYYQIVEKDNLMAIDLINKAINKNIIKGMPLNNPPTEFLVSYKQKLLRFYFQKMTMELCVSPKDAYKTGIKAFEEIGVDCSKISDRVRGNATSIEKDIAHFLYLVRNYKHNLKDPLTIEDLSAMAKLTMNIKGIDLCGKY